VWGLSPQSRKTESDHLHVQRVFKCHVSLAYAEALSSKFKDQVRLPPRTASLQASYLVDMCGGSLLKVERPSPITPHVQRVFKCHVSLAYAGALSPKFKTKSNRHSAQRVFKHCTSLTCVGALSSKSKDRVRSLPRTTSLQVLEPAGVTLTHSKR